MELYNMLKNIRGIDNEKELIDSIRCVKSKLFGLTEERMCKVYNSYLWNELRKRHIPARLINTLDLEYNYEHVFILVSYNDNQYFLADLTFSQFETKDGFEKLLIDGYQIINNNLLSSYVNIVTKENLKQKICVDDLFYGTFDSIENSKRI